MRFVLMVVYKGGNKTTRYYDTAEAFQNAYGAFSLREVAGIATWIEPSE